MSACTFLTLLIGVFFVTLVNCNLENKKLYEPTWDSLDLRPLPNWYDRAKVGIFIHWGVYSVPSYGSEWFWTNWIGNSSGYVDYMNKNFKPGFTYQEFARDFTAEHFNPNEWTRIFEKSGAKYVVLTSKHHEGFTMWPSIYSFSWNSMDIGPHRDIVGELAKSIKMTSNMKFGLYHSLFEWFNPLYLTDKLNSFNTSKFVDFKVWPELQEIVNKYQPEIIWSDGEWEASDTYWKSKEFLTWLYNESPVRDDVVTNDRWGGDTLCKHGGFHTCTDRFNPGVLKTHKWENAMTIDKYSWGQRANAKLEDFMTSHELIKELVTTISCGGNILVNVGPTKTGIIEPIFVERLYTMGSWLKVNGEAIYDSIPWKYQNDSITPDIWYTAGIPTNNRQNVYAIILEYPYAELGIHLYSIKGFLDSDSQVKMLGYNNTTLDFNESDDSVFVHFPNKQFTDKLGLELAWTLKFDIPV